VHYRSDGVEGSRLGEAVSIRILEDARRCLTEDFGAFELTTFDGVHVRI
jgi:hypothetical protein